MIVEHLELVDFRNYVTGTFDLHSGTTLVIGDNGQGKTNLAEALAFLATLTSFRSAPGDALVVNATQVPVEMYDTHGAKGAALGGGIGAGIFKTIKEAMDGLTLLKVVEPDSKQKDQYANAYAKNKNKLISDPEDEKKASSFWGRKNGKDR